MTEAAGGFASPGLHVIATDVDVDDVADLLARLSVPVDAVVDGDLALSPYQDAAENLFLGHEPRRFGLVDRSRMRREAAEVFARFGLDLSPDGPPALSPDDHLLFALARIAVQDASAGAINADRLDDPSGAALNACGHLTSQGISVVVVGAAVGAYLVQASTVTVVSLESGVARVIGTCAPGPLASDAVVALLEGDHAAGARASGPTCTTHPQGAQSALPVHPILSVSAWTVPAIPGASHAVADRVSFDVYGGEVAALTGHGSRELALSLFGASMGPATAGRVCVRSGADEEVVDVGALSVSETISVGLSYGSERPLAYDVGLLGGIPTSVSGAALKRLAASGVIDSRRAYATSRRPLVAALRGGEDPSAFTDVLRSWGDDGPAVVILDEPLVADREARVSAVRELAARGAAILIVSSRPADIADSADRLFVAESGSIRDVVELGAGPSELRLGPVLRARLRVPPRL
jgi:ABC-type sugar transport system ATPase subunit